MLKAALLACAVAVTGCETYYGAGRMEEATREREDMLLLREDVRILKGRIETLEMQQDSVRQDVEGVRRDSASSVEGQLDYFKRSLEEMDRRIANLEVARQKDKQEIIDKLSEKMAGLMSRQGGGGTTRSTKPAASGYGYEHEVQGGETLSEIAKAYGVTVKTILDNNDVKDPNRLQVGQKLFIPE